MEWGWIILVIVAVVLLLLFVAAFFLRTKPSAGGLFSIMGSSGGKGHDNLKTI